jgi:hypothetical protein
MLSSLAVTVLTALASGLTPALSASKVNVLTLLRGNGMSTSWPRMREPSALLPLQIAITTVLLVGAGLFLRSLERARHIELGFDPDGLMVASLDLGLQGYDRDAGKEFLRRVLDRVSALPGVESVSLASAIPLELNITRISVQPEGQVPLPGAAPPSVDFAVVHSGYFRTLRTPLLEGRDFSLEDRAGSRPVILVNEILADRYWPGRARWGSGFHRPPDLRTRWWGW